MHHPGAALQVRTYVCGILYAVLQRPAVHAEAVQRDLAGLLRAVAANCGSELSASQINYVVEQVCTGEGLPCGQYKRHSGKQTTLERQALYFRR